LTTHLLPERARFWQQVRGQRSGPSVDGARPLAVDLLSVADARELLVRRLGHDRVAAEPAAVDDIIASTARLPLALSVVTARAATNPEFTLAALAGELRDARGSLDVFDGGDPATNVRAVFACSYDGLSGPAAHLFRLLGLHCGPEISSLAAANLAALPPATARQLLAELARAHLITERTPGRFLMHDLLRAYAQELVDRHETPENRRAAVHRALDYYLLTADLAGRLLFPHRDDPLRLPPSTVGVRPASLTERRQAMAWLTDEEPALLAAGRQAAREGFDRHVWQLVWALSRYLYCRGLWHEAVASAGEALRAAQRLDDPRGRAISHGCLAYAYIRLGEHDVAQQHLRQAFDLFSELGDHTGMAHSHRSITWALDRQQRHREALPHAYEALRLFRLSGHRTGEARALNGVGWFHLQLGDHDRALEYCRQALALQDELGDRLDAADTLDSLGVAYHRLGRFDDAAESYRQAIDRYSESGDLFNLADSLVSLGESHLAAGDPKSTQEAWDRAVGILEGLGHPESEVVRMKLKDLDTTDVLTDRR
jgi:tetratricopeptide (TPR) repeat protein